MPRDAIAREYALLAQHYDQRWRRYLGASIHKTLEYVNAGPGDRVLDVGCGTGVLLDQLHRRSPDARLVGVDLSAQMLEVARKRLPADVELHLARADRLPFADAGFDILASTSVFHYLPDPSAALREWTRVLRPRGKLAITDWCADYLSIRMLERHLHRFRPAHVRAYRIAELAELLARAGCQIGSMERYRIDWLWGLMTLSAVTAPRS